MTHLRLARLAGPAAAILLAAACADPTAPTTSSRTPNFAAAGELGDWVLVCKQSTFSNTNYSFTVSATGGSFVFPSGQNFNLFVYQANSEPPSCTRALQVVGTGAAVDPTTFVTVSEVNIPAGQNVSKIEIYDNAQNLLATVVGKTSVTVEATFHAGKIVKFYNDAYTPPPPPPPPGGQGCTPGYWKQPQHFGSWVGYQTTNRYNTVFGRNFFSDNRTLLTALSTGGGGKDRFGRHSTAALLNASNPAVDYGMTAAQVIAAVRAAIDAGTTDALATKFEGMNESGCSLGRDELDD